MLEQLENLLNRQKNVLNRMKNIKFISGHNQKSRILRNIEIEIIKVEYQIKLFKNPPMGAQ